MTVRELGERMDAEEFASWQDFAEVEPFGALADDIRFGTIASMYRNAHRRDGDSAISALEVWHWRNIESSEEALREMVTRRKSRKAETVDG